jgi:hypothetical protein
MRPVEERCVTVKVEARHLRADWRVGFFWLCFLWRRYAIASGLGAIGEAVIEISQTHNYRSGIIVFQFFGRSAHLGGARPQML